MAPERTGTPTARLKTRKLGQIELNLIAGVGRNEAIEPAPLGLVDLLVA